MLDVQQPGFVLVEAHHQIGDALPQSVAQIGHPRDVLDLLADVLRKAGQNLDVVAEDAHLDGGSGHRTLCQDLRFHGGPGNLVQLRS